LHFSFSFQGERQLVTLQSRTNTNVVTYLPTGTYSRDAVAEIMPPTKNSTLIGKINTTVRSVMPALNYNGSYGTVSLKTSRNRASENLTAGLGRIDTTTARKLWRKGHKPDM